MSLARGCYSLDFKTSAELPHANASGITATLLRRVSTRRREAYGLRATLFGMRGALPTEERHALSGLFRRAYSGIAVDRDMHSLPSAIGKTLLPRPGVGHAFLSVPPILDAAKTPIMFLHGYGGNLLWNMWGLRQCSSDRLLLLPSWSISWSDGGSSSTLDRLQYLHDLKQCLARQHGMTFNRPWLYALSGGGPAAYWLVDADPALYAGLVALATAPLGEAPLAIPDGLPVLMINGTRDGQFPATDAMRDCLAMRKRGINCHFAEMDADHYFFLSRTQAMRDLIDVFVAKLGMEH
jgi:hypothetical protein